MAPGLSYGSGKFESASGNTIDRWAVGDDTRVCFQYSATDAVPKGSPGYLTNDELYAELVKDLKDYGAQDVQVGSTPMCYCHHFLRAACLPTKPLVGAGTPLVYPVDHPGLTTIGGLAELMRCL